MEELLKGIASGAGVAGAVLAYHLWVHAKNMEDLRKQVSEMDKKFSEAIDRSTRADLLRMIASPHVSTEVKNTAADLMKELDAADTERKK